MKIRLNQIALTRVDRWWQHIFNIETTSLIRQRRFDYDYDLWITILWIEFNFEIKK